MKEQLTPTLNIDRAVVTVWDDGEAPDPLPADPRTHPRCKRIFFVDGAGQRVTVYEREEAAPCP